MPWIATLKAAGYTVTQGIVTLFPVPCSGSGNNYINYLGSCFGNNTSTPYLLVAPPAPSGQTNNLPSYITQYFSEPAVGNDPTPYNFYELDNDEALITIFTLPPQAAFYAYQTYMFERQTLTGYGIQGSLGTQCTPGAGYPTGAPKYKLSYDSKFEEFGFFTNAVNNRDVLAQSGLQFNADPTSTNARAIAIVTTPNSDLYANVQGYFNSTPNLIAGQLFVEGMPAGVPAGGGSPLLLTGLTATSDIFATLIRYTLPEVFINGKDWYENSQTNVLIYRIKAPTTVGSTLYNASNFLHPSFNTDETLGAANNCPTIGTATSQSYYCDIQELGYLLDHYLKAKGNTEPYAFASSSSLPVGGVGVNGPACITNGTPCAGGTQDTDAYYSKNIEQLLTQGPAFVIGVNHASSPGDPAPSATPINNADYTGVSSAVVVHNEGVSDDTQPNATSTFPPSMENPVLTTGLSGSAAAVVSAFGLQASTALTHDLPNLYVAVFYRQQSGIVCNGLAYCLPNQPFVTYIQGSNQGAPNYISQTSSVLLTERGYSLPPPTPSSLPALSTGADPAHTQPPYVLYDTAG